MGGGKSSPLADISPNGDVILVVGPRNVRLRVQSTCLRCASKVFDVMFGPRWSEGEGLSEEYAKEVSLPEADADALRIICCIIHHRNDAVPLALTPREVLQIAIEVDKYDLGVALKYAIAQWLQPRGSTDIVDMGYLMTAAFLFDDMEVFTAHSLELVLHYRESYIRLLENDILRQSIPWKLVYLLEERRNRMRAELSQLLLIWGNDACFCGWGKKRNDRYKTLQFEYGPLRMLEVPISEIIKKMDEVSLEDNERKYHSPRPNSEYPGFYHEALAHHATFTQKLETLKKNVSICLDCVHSSDSEGILQIS